MSGGHPITRGLALVALVCASLHAQTSTRAGSAAVADAILWGRTMAAADRTSDLRPNVQKGLTEYRQREQAFHTSLKPPPGATALEGELFEKRVAIERVLFCLFPRRDIARIAASYASDAEVAGEWDGTSDPPRREAAFIDALLRDLPEPWLAPYLDLVAGHRKLCASQLQGPDSDGDRAAIAGAGRRQLARARDAGHPLIRIAAEHMLATGRCTEP